MEVSSLYELGSHLKAHREKMGLEREDIALRIKISAKNLHAIEEGLLDNLPQPVFTKSFIRSYAKAMEMDMEDIGRRIEEVFPSEAIDNVRHDLTPSAREQSVGINQAPGGRKILLVIAVLALLALAFGGWMYFGKTSADGGERAPYSSELGASRAAPGNNGGQAVSGRGDGGAAAQNPADGEAGAAAQTSSDAPRDGAQALAGRSGQTGSGSTGSGLAGSDGPAGPVGQTGQAGRTAEGSPASTQQTVAAAGQGGAQTAQPGQAGQTAQGSQTGGAAQQTAQAGQGGQAGQTTQVAQTAQLPQPGRITQSNTVSQSNASAATPLESGKQRVIVSAVSGDCWVGAKFDAIGERNVNLLTGRHFVLEFNEKLTLTLGNAGVVRVSYNGRPVSFTAADGDVRILRFPPNAR